MYPKFLLIIASLLSACATWSMNRPEYHNPYFFQAINNADIPKISQHLANKESVFQTDRHGNTAIHEAIDLEEDMAVKVISLLIPFSPNLNAKNHFDITPLGRAIYQYKPKVIKLLLEKGADPNELYGDGTVPLLAAMRKTKDPSVVEMLLAHNASIKKTILPDKPTTYPSTVILDLFRKDSLKRNHELNKSPLECAQEIGNEEILKLLRRYNPT